MHRRLAERHVASGRGLSEHRPSGHHGLNLSDPVAMLRGNIRSELGTWARDLAGERGFGLPFDDMRDICRFLVGADGRNLDWRLARPTDDVIEFHDNVETLGREAFRLLYPSGRRRFEVGVCIEVTACDVATQREQRCPGRMITTLYDTDSEFRSNLWCDECGVEITADQWVTYGRRVHREMEAV
jgi:hypothetical protein